MKDKKGGYLPGIINNILGDKGGPEIIMTTQGKKFDDEKLRMDLLSTQAIEGIAEILTFGAKKYGDRNWEKGLNYSRIFAALLRHLFAWWQGEDIDPESGLHHIDHVACNAHFLQHFIKTIGGLDDRPSTLEKQQSKNVVGVHEKTGDIIYDYTARKCGIPEQYINIKKQGKTSTGVVKKTPTEKMKKTLNTFACKCDISITNKWFKTALKKSAKDLNKILNKMAKKLVNEHISKAEIKPTGRGFAEPRKNDKPTGM
jgi:hypothetical protein